MKVTTPSHVIFETLDEHAVLLNLDSGTYFQLNPTAARIWTLIQDHGDTQEILAAMKDEFNADTELLQRDLENLLQDLKERGLITTGEA